MNEHEPNLRFLVMRAVITVAVVLIVLLVLRFSKLVHTDYEIPVSAVQTALET